MECLCQWELKAPTDRSQSDYVHEQVAKADCECPLYTITYYKIETLDFLKRTFKIFLILFLFFTREIADIYI